MALVQVESLGRLSLLALTGPVVAAVRAAGQDEADHDHDEDKTVLDARRYLEAAPAAVLQELLRALLSLGGEVGAELPPRLRYWSLRLLLRPDVATLSMGGPGAFPSEYHGKLVRCVSALGAGLHTLDLKGAWLRGDDLDAFCDVLASGRLAALRVLGAPRTATDPLLAAVGRHCPKLRALDVSGDTCVTREGLEALCKGGVAASLQVLDVGNLAEESITAEDAAFLLRSLPNLVSMGTFAHVGNALLSLQEPTRLEYLHDTATSSRVMDAVLRLCPALHAVYLDSPERGVVAQLAGLPRLGDVKLHRFHCADLLDLLQGMGSRLTDLELLGGAGSPLDLSRVAALCPRLSRLECYLVDCTSSGSAAWPSLRSVGLFHAHLPRHALLDVVLGAASLHRLAVGCPQPDLSDDDVADLCGADLGEVWIADAARLTQAAALCMLTGCPRLTSLGELSGWDLNPDEVEELRGHCTRCNLDVNLWYFPRD